MTPPKPRRRSLLVTLPALLAAGGCTAPQVRTELYRGAAGPRPERILVHDFAIRPQEVRLDSGVRGRLLQAFSPETPSEQQYQAARQVSRAVTDALAEELARSGIPVERVAALPAPGAARILVIEGQVLGVDEGNRTRRTLIGFGRGMSSVEVGTQLYLMQPGAPARLLGTFEGRADSGYAPGAAGTLGAGAVAGRLATSAAVGGAAQVLEGSRAEDTAEARRIGRSLGERVRAYLVQQGWAGAPG